MTNQTNYLYQKLDNVFEMGLLSREIPNLIKDNLNPNFELRPYQIEAFSRFIYYFNDYPQKQCPIHLLFNMATGSGKTIIMAGLIIYLYTKGYRNFLFFVNSTNIIEKTKDNFLNNLSTKYLFNQKIIIENQAITINKVDNFEGGNTNDINICFTTIQKLHTDLIIEKENAITLDDFKDKEIVLLWDESHHGQVKTKTQHLSVLKEYEKPSWENTVEQILKQHKKNVLLEFTATMDFFDKNVEQKYLNKIIYKYDLKEFRQDKYSKEVSILQADLSNEDRILTAIILNQYRQDIATKYKINLKPVILFKAKKTIAESQKNKELFHELIENLSEQSIASIKINVSINELQTAFRFYRHENISETRLVNKLKQNFAPNKTLSVNDEKEKEANQLLINSLEDKDNQIRAIFAVQKLNEGWDVLNLFDIVRLYNTRDGKSGKPGKTTIAEAQLIGRGARYCPFKLDNAQDKYTRKYDEDLTHELRILEELHYHCLNEPRYISEIRTALSNSGMLDNKYIEKELTLKESFKDTDFYQNGLIYLNKKIKNNYRDVRSFDDLNIKQRDFKYKLQTYQGKTTNIFNENEQDQESVAKTVTKTIPLKDIESHIVKNALTRNDFFRFSTIKIYFPWLQSLNDIIEKNEYLGSIKIVFEGMQEHIETISNRDKFQALVNILSEIEARIKTNLIEYKGSQEFKPSNIHKIFNNKTLNLKKSDERVNGQEDQIKHWDWFAFNANYGTEEEKACVRLMARMVEEEFKKKYDDIFLIRNERHFNLFNFRDGQGFSPDFVLFLKEKNDQMLTYQIFIEPKGSHLVKPDKWKEDFLLELKANFKDTIITFNKNRKYTLIGVPFYNQDKENTFRNELIKSFPNPRHQRPLNDTNRSM